MKLIVLVVSVLSCFHSTIGFRARINHGEIADKNHFKYVVSIHIYEPVGLKNFFKTTTSGACTGGIIHDKFILTSAHCFAEEKKHLITRKTYYEFKQKKVKVYAHTNKKLSGPISRKAIKVYFLADFFKNGLDDIAILELAEGLHLHGKNKDHLEKLELPPKAYLGHRVGEYKSYSGSECVIAGSGKDEKKGHDDGRLKHMTTEIIDHSKCDHTDYKRVLCGKAVTATGDHPKHPLGICGGDSGGPVVYTQNPRTPLESVKKIVIGIATSSNKECDGRDSNDPEIYMRVSHYMDFIEHVLKNWDNNSRKYVVHETAS